MIIVLMIIITIIMMMQEIHYLKKVLTLKMLIIYHKIIMTQIKVNLILKRIPIILRIMKTLKKGMYYLKRKKKIFFNFFYLN